MFAKEEADLHSESPLSMRAKELSRNQKRMERVMQEIKNEMELEGGEQREQHKKANLVTPDCPQV